MNRTIDIVCAGETLIDFIGAQEEQPILATKDYHRYLGGSPTNVAINMARLGKKVELVASIGNDGFGHYVIEKLNEAGVGSNYLLKSDKNPTTVIFINRTQHTPEFIAFRGADKQIITSQVPKQLLEKSKIFHTTCFALSKNPARKTIIKAAENAFNLGCQLSIDLNYAPKIWPNNTKAQQTIAKYLSFNPLVKVSQDDIDRLYGKGLSHEEVFSKLHHLGAKLICFTLGKNGAKLSEKDKTPISLSALKIEKIMDATGAGDAFWSGFLFAYLHQKSTEKCMETALQMAAIKLQNVGRIPDYANIITQVLEN